MATTISLMIYEAHMNTFFIIKVKILDLNKWPYNPHAPLSKLMGLV